MRLSWGCLAGIAIWLVVLGTARSAAAGVDRDKLMSDPGTYATFVVYELDRDWWKLARPARAKAAKEVTDVFGKHADKVVVDMVLLRGLTDRADLLVRVHSTALAHNQELLVAFGATTFGRHLASRHTWSAVTKKPNYVPSLPDDMKATLKTQPEPGPKAYAILIPVKKDAAWWVAPQDQRNAMMKEHTAASLASLVPVKRKLYHASGFADVDFITYFETSKLDEFNNLIINLMKVRENRHNAQFGGPVVIGTIHPVDKILAVFAS
jgi:chlorite dismutase